jgi:hypothetical protein
MMNIKTEIFRDLIPYSLVAGYECFISIIRVEALHPEDGSSMFLRDIGTHLPDSVM